jgi:predicted phosphodiesterase
MKIAIIGDMHLRERSPSCRKDDYLTNVLDKLDFVLKNNDKVICLGDMFNTYNNTDYLFFRIYSLLSNYPNKFISILGNHDIIGRNHNDLSKTTIGSLFATGAVDLKKENFSIDGVTFAVSLVDKSNFEDIPIDKNNENVLLGHNYLNFELCAEESLDRSDLKKLNYRQVFLGHDHKPYEDDYISNSHVIRMGSFTRCDTQDYNEDREIAYYEYDTKTREVERKVVSSLPKDIVFTDNAFERMKYQKKSTNFIKIGEVLKRFNKQSEGNISLLKTLERANCPPKYVAMIKTFHEVNGIAIF